MTLRNDSLEASIRYDGSTRSLQLIASAAEALTSFEGEASAAGDGHLLTGPLSTANPRRCRRLSRRCARRRSAATAPPSAPATARAWPLPVRRAPSPPRAPA